MLPPLELQVKELDSDPAAPFLPLPEEAFQDHGPFGGLRRTTTAWGEEHDRRLLRGIMKHGYSQWKEIGFDPEIGLQQVLREEAQVPAGGVLVIGGVKVMPIKTPPAEGAQNGEGSGGGGTEAEVKAESNGLQPRSAGGGESTAGGTEREEEGKGEGGRKEDVVLPEPAPKSGDEGLVGSTAELPLVKLADGVVAGAPQEEDGVEKQPNGVEHLTGERQAGALNGAGDEERVGLENSAAGHLGSTLLKGTDMRDREQRRVGLESEKTEGGDGGGARQGGIPEEGARASGGGGESTDRMDVDEESERPESMGLKQENGEGGLPPAENSHEEGAGGGYSKPTAMKREEGIGGLAPKHGESAELKREVENGARRSSPNENGEAVAEKVIGGGLSEAGENGKSESPGVPGANTPGQADGLVSNQGVSQADPHLQRRIVEWIKRRVALLEKALNTSHLIKETGNAYIEEVPESSSESDDEEGFGGASGFGGLGSGRGRGGAVKPGGMELPGPAFVPISAQEVAAMAPDQNPERLEVINLYNNMCKLLLETRFDAHEAYRGNKAAGLRLRKASRELDTMGNSIRQALVYKTKRKSPAEKTEEGTAKESEQKGETEGERGTANGADGQEGPDGMEVDEDETESDSDEEPGTPNRASTEPGTPHRVCEPQSSPKAVIERREEGEQTEGLRQGGAPTGVSGASFGSPAGRQPVTVGTVFGSPILAVQAGRSPGRNHQASPPVAKRPEVDVEKQKRDLEELAASLNVGDGEDDDWVVPNSDED
jgi:hypothetical protein